MKQSVSNITFVLALLMVVPCVGAQRKQHKPDVKLKRAKEDVTTEATRWIVGTAVAVCGVYWWNSGSKVENPDDSSGDTSSTKSDAGDDGESHDVDCSTNVSDPTDNQDGIESDGDGKQAGIIAELQNLEQGVVAVKEDDDHTQPTTSSPGKLATLKNMMGGFFKGSKDAGTVDDGACGW